VTLDWTTDESDVGNGTVAVTVGNTTLTRNITVEETDNSGGAVAPEIGDNEYEMVDSEPDEPGTTVSLESETPVESVSFDSEMNGTLTVESTGLPDQAMQAIAEQTRMNESAEVITALDIEPSGELGEDETATVEFTVPESAVEAPEHATILHRSSTGWKTISTTVQGSDNGTVRLSGSVDSFSVFAVVYAQASPEETDTAGTQTTARETTGTAAEGPGFGVGVSVVAVLVAALLARRR